MSKAVYGSLMVVALAVALALRLVAADARPMHHDEANQAVRFGALLETGRYEYDRTDHHGPTLYYLTLPAAWGRGQATLASLDERTLRLVPALFGAALLLLMLPLGEGLGRGATVAAAWLAALSPALVYYARAYIQETLFVFFVLAFLLALGRYAERPRGLTAVVAGVAAGLAYATKETSVIALPAALVAALVAGAGRHAGRRPAWFRDAALALGMALAVAVLFYSSFFSHPAGFAESIRAFDVYFDRGMGASVHLQPWDYYLRLLAWSRAGGPVWTEGLVLALALVGLVVAVRAGARPFWPRYVVVYTVLSTVAFSAIPYKTPWNLLPFYLGAVLLAGFGAASLAAALRPRVVQGLAVAALAAGCVHLGLQAWRASVTYGADPRNPYVYAQTVPDFLRLVRRIDDLAALHPDREAMSIRVVAGPYEQWPLPWYLRAMTRVGYWTQTDQAGAMDDGPIVVVSQENEAAAEAALGERYVSEHYGLRPEVILTLFVERGLWERYLATRDGPSEK